MTTMSIYVADDAADYRFLVQQVFNRFLPQYSLTLFDDGMSLIQHMERLDSAEQGPGLIVLDLDMPKMSGIQTLAWLGQQPHWQTVPVVMMSNRSDSSFKDASYQRGASGYIEKPTPFSIQDLRDTFNQLCAKWLAA